MRKINHLIHKFLGNHGIMIRRTNPRPMISYIKKNIQQNKNLIGIEIGVWKGENAKSILKSLQIKKLYLIDPYIPSKEWGEDTKEAYSECIKKLSKHKNKIKIIRKKSEDAIIDIKEKVDFIYIDGNHTYDFVKRDIKLYKPLIKNGGIIGGHDIEIGDVSKAVFEEFESDEVIISFPDWWVKLESRNIKNVNVVKPKVEKRQ